MADNYYRILNVRPSSSQDEIKKAYRKLAKKFHPDVNKGKPQYEERFKAINNAYQVLGDEDLRRDYDNRLRMEELNSVRHRQNSKSRYAGTDAKAGARDYSSGKSDSSVRHQASRPVRPVPRYRRFIFSGFSFRWFLIASCVTPMIKLCVRPQSDERPFPKRSSVAAVSLKSETTVNPRPETKPVADPIAARKPAAPARKAEYEYDPPREELAEDSTTESTASDEVVDSGEPVKSQLRRVERVGPSPEENTIFNSLLSCNRQNDWQECDRISALGIEKFSSPERLGTAYFVGFIARFNREKSDDTMTFFADMMQYHQEGSISLAASYLAQSYRAALLLSIELNNSAYYYSLRDPAVSYTEEFPEYSAAVRDSIDLAEKTKGWLAH